MWNRKELKEKAKAAVKRNYWKAVLVSAIFTSAIGGANVATQPDTSQEMSNSVNSLFQNTGILIATSIFAIIIVALLVILYIAIMEPFFVGVSKFRLNALESTGNVSDVGHGYDVSYKRNVKVMFFKDLYTILWTCLFIIPGIIKSYEYRLIPYILADNPDMDKEEVFKTSKELMKGNKWRTFILDLSFILWGILGAITFGLVNVLWVDPYKHLTDAALYVALKEGNR